MTRLAMFAALIILPTILAACHSSDPPPEPTRDELARTSYARIAENANVILKGDYLGWFERTDDVERTRVRCKAGVCSAGFIRFLRPGSYSVEGVELEFLGPGYGVDLVKERAETESALTDVYGGWMEHAFFAAEAVRFVHPDDPDRGATLISTYALGHSSGENPAGSAEWRGFMIGRDTRHSETRGEPVLGDAFMAFDLATATIDIKFTGIGVAGGTFREAMAWRGLAVEDGAFSQRRALDDTISASFFGPDEEEVAGVFERDEIAGAFGGTREPEAVTLVE